MITPMRISAATRSPRGFAGAVTAVSAAGRALDDGLRGGLAVRRLGRQRRWRVLAAHRGARGLRRGEGQGGVRERREGLPHRALGDHRREARGELRGALVAVLGALRHGLQQHVFEARGEGAVGRANAQANGRGLHVQGDELHGRARVEGQLAREQLVEDHREGVHVAARVEGLPLRLLGRHELGRAEDHPLLREDQRPRLHLPLGDLREAEIKHLGEVFNPPCLQRKMFSGLRSRWMIPFWWASSRAPHA